jgi:hypothetical protein
MPKLYCKVSEGLRQAEATVTVSEYDGTVQHCPLDRGLISTTKGKPAVPVGVVHYAANGQDDGLALVSLPVEADSGTQRIWVRLSDLILEKEPVK